MREITNNHIQIKRSLEDFLEQQAFTCEQLEGNSIIATFGETTLLLTERDDGCFAGKAVTMPKEEILEMYQKYTENSSRKDPIGWWAYENNNLVPSSQLRINNHDHSVYEIKAAISRMQNQLEFSLKTIINRAGLNIGIEYMDDMFDKYLDKQYREKSKDWIKNGETKIVLSSDFTKEQKGWIKDIADVYQLSTDQIKILANPDFGEALMEEIGMAFDNGLTLEQVEKLTDKQYDIEQVHQIRMAFQLNLSNEHMDTILNPENTAEQMNKLMHELYFEEIKSGEIFKEEPVADKNYVNFVVDDLLSEANDFVNNHEQSQHIDVKENDWIR